MFYYSRTSSSFIHFNRLRSSIVQHSYSASKPDVLPLLNNVANGFIFRLVEMKNLSQVYLVYVTNSRIRLDMTFANRFWAVHWARSRLSPSDWFRMLKFAHVFFAVSSVNAAYEGSWLKGGWSVTSFRIGRSDWWLSSSISYLVWDTASPRKSGRSCVR